MRKTYTLTISLPPEMLAQFEKVRKAEFRTRSELIREALRTYFYSRFPVVGATKSEQAAIRTGREAIRRGEYLLLKDYLNGMDIKNIKSGHQKSKKTTRKR